jgi:threonine dehydrogenase-like Zn-dependent dehydrogenase
MMQLARLAGAKQVLVSEPSEKRRELALSLGADFAIDPVNADLADEVIHQTGVGPDVVIECVGSPATAEQAMPLVKKGGLVLLFGVAGMDAVAGIKPYDLFLREVTIRGSFVNPHTHSRAIGLLASGRINVEPLISHRLRLDEFGKALDMFGKPGVAKILVSP